MRKAIPMSALIAALLAVPAMAEGLGQITILPDGTIMCDSTNRVEQMQQLQQRITRQVQERIARALAGMNAMEIATEVPRGTPVVQFAQLERPAEGQLMFAPAPVETEKAAYMGVATLPVPAVLRDQLKLQRGMGLVVMYVEKGSPAAEAGVQQNDVLEKLDDQVLVNGQQLAVLVRAKKPGDAVKLTLLRAGAVTTADVKLAEKEVPVMEDDGSFRMQPGAPLPGALGAAGAPEGAPPWQHGVRKTVFSGNDGSLTRRLVNGDYDITVKTDKEGSSTLVAKDRTGKEVYNGPYTTDKEKAAVPTEIVPLVKDLVESGHFTPGAADEAAHSEMVRVDSAHRITLARDGSEKHLKIVEVDTGKVLYDGPADSDDVKNLPQDVQDKVKALTEKARMQQ